MPQSRRPVWPARAALVAGVLALSVPVAVDGAQAAAPAGVVARAVQAPRDAPFDVPDQLTDRAGVLGSDLTALRAELEQLRSDDVVQVFFVYVDSFDDLDGERWAEQTYSVSGMGGEDVLVAVATQDRRYGTWTTSESGISPGEDSQVRARYIEPALADNDWSGAVRAAAEGYGRAARGDNELDSDPGSESGTTGDGGGSGLPWGLLLLPVGGVVAYGLVRRASSRRGATQGGAGGPAGGGAPPVPTEELRRRAASSLVDVDDAIRSSTEELSYAQAQFGVQSTQTFSAALEEARRNAAEAFRLQRELDDAESMDRVDEAGSRSYLERIIALASAADSSLDAQEAEFARLRDLEARVPEFLAELKGRAAEVRRRLPVAEQELAGLATQYPAESLRTVRGNVEQAEQLLSSAEAFISTGLEHVTAGDRPAAVAAGRASEEAVGQADTLLTSVSRARTDLAGAVERIDASLRSISSDIADAERLGADDQFTRTAVEAARAAVAQSVAARDTGDPLAAIRSLTRAEQDLDNALARYREAETHKVRASQLLEVRLREVGARLASIDQYIASRRGAVRASARTGIATALSLHRQAAEMVADPQQATPLLDQAEAEGERALAQAGDDLDSWGGHQGTVAGPRGLDPTSLILGGILSGGFGNRGGGWGGSGGGFGGGGFGGGGLGGGGFGGGGRF
ncbi:TPM domain-containing protein [Knoellia sp. CPCC 206435]|uniref:TPM domain-containing protein n=1 Tax=Knoellia terrae TaxID=3404797 RepID=UPI003B43B0AE